MFRERVEHQVKAPAEDLGTARSEGLRIVPDQRGQGSYQQWACVPPGGRGEGGQMKFQQKKKAVGPTRESNSEPPAPEAGIIPLDQRARFSSMTKHTTVRKLSS